MKVSKAKIVRVLIKGGLLLFILSLVTVSIITITSELVAIIGMGMLIPVFIGLFLYSREIEDKREKLSYLIKKASIIYFIYYTIITIAWIISILI